jgi:hypothetical protein
LFELWKANGDNIFVDMKSEYVVLGTISLMTLLLNCYDLGYGVIKDFSIFTNTAYAVGKINRDYLQLMMHRLYAKALAYSRKVS